MGIEGGSSNSEVQNQEINQSINEQIEQNQAEHQRSGEELEGNTVRLKKKILNGRGCLLSTFTIF